MDTATLVENELKENEVLKKKLKCYNCNVFPKLGSKIYICRTCQVYKCENCFIDYDKHIASYYTGCNNKIDFDPIITEVWSVLAKSNYKQSVESVNSFICSHSENGCQEEFLAQKAHEKACIYQKVSCPSMDCKESVIFKDMDVHLDQAHKIEKVNDEWNFEGTMEF